MCESYNGWPNYPTWHAFTAITGDGDAWIYALMAECAEERVFAERLCKELEDGYWETGLWIEADDDVLLAGLLSYVWEQIDWMHIADHFWLNKGAI